MIVIIPAIYFLLLLIYILFKNGFDISACIISIYLITSILSIVIFYSDSSGVNSGVYKGDPSLLPTLIYCSMITLVTKPFISYNSNRKRALMYVNVKAYDILSWCFIISFFFVLILFKDDLIFRLQAGDSIGDMRGQEIENAQQKLSGPLRFLSTVAVSICSVSAICFILFFYGIIKLKKPLWFYILLLISSTGCILQGIMGIDRSISFYWIINFVFIFTLFKVYLNKRVKKSTYLFALVVLFALGSYLVMLSRSRFGNAAVDSFINYMGQSYLNFCWFWDNYDAPFVNLGIFFPISSHFFIDWGHSVSAVPFGYEVQSQVGYFVNVFYTFMGSIMLYLGQWAVVPYCIAYYFVVRNLLKYRRKAYITTFIVIFIAAIIPYDGVILYLLMDYIKAFGFLFVICFFKYLNSRKHIIMSIWNKDQGQRLFFLHTKLNGPRKSRFPIFNKKEKL